MCGKIEIDLSKTLIIPRRRKIIFIALFLYFKPILRYKYYLLNWKWMTCFLTFECAKVYFAIFCFFFSLPPYWKSYELFMYARQCSKLRKNKIVILQLRWCRDLTNCPKKWFFKKCCLYPMGQPWFRIKFSIFSSLHPKSRHSCHCSTKNTNGILNSNNIHFNTRGRGDLSHLMYRWRYYSKGRIISYWFRKKVISQIIDIGDSKINFDISQSNCSNLEIQFWEVSFYERCHTQTT